MDYFYTILLYPVHLDDYTWLGCVVTKCGVVNAGTVTQHALVEWTGPLCMFWSVERVLDEVLSRSTVVMIALCLYRIVVC